MHSSAAGVAVATTSQIAADAAREVAELGGNAVDCGIAAAMCSINTQPGVCALAGSAFVTIWAAGSNPVTIDGNVAVPGLGTQGKRSPQINEVELTYGGGVRTLVGASSVAVPGTLAALHLAWKRYGKISWPDLLRPSIRAARDGFPLAAACHHYLKYSGHKIFGRSADGFRALHDEDGNLRPPASSIFVPGLEQTLAAIASEGPAPFYCGDIGRRIVAHVQDEGGLLTMQDLQDYSPVVRDSLMVTVRDWKIATNPAPAIGGASLAAMLKAFGTTKIARWDATALRRLIRTQHAVMSFRLNKLDSATELDEPIAELLGSAASADFLAPGASGATVHTSAVDGAQLACSITASSGYGAGDMPAATGLWLNNCLGELELNQQGLNATPPGRRLPSNMAPSVARSADSVLALGSPGADRITTALHQFLVNFIQLNLDLSAAVAHPRMHLKLKESDTVLAVEPGIDVPAIDFGVARYPEKDMYFGGVVAAMVEAVRSSSENRISAHRFSVAADPRREGGTLVREAE